MFTLIKKEINSFFSTLSGYIAIIVFLLANSMFLWVFPGEFNILDNGYATIDSLFIIAPWIFLFLIPAITMRLFSEEKRAGTIELLLTRPVSDFNIVLSKYLSGVVIVLFSLVPALIYFLSVYLLGSPVGNIDTGGTWGSFIGLFFLAAVYVAIGVFSSSLTENQIISFIIALILSFIFYIGFESISTMGGFNKIEGLIVNLGINEHYKSIRRGVIDTRDLLYFCSVITLFIFFTKYIIQSRKW